MIWNPFQGLFSQKKFLGVDIGTSCIKIVELSQSGNKQKLENYGFLQAAGFWEKPFWTFEKNSLSFSTQNIAKAIEIIIQEAGIKTQRVIFSVPDFTTFFTNFELPSMTKKELEQAVQYEAKQHIPLSLKEVFLDWQVIEGRALGEKEKSSVQQKKLKILLVAVSNEIIKQYQEIAKISQLELVSLEAEVFSLIRTLAKKNEKGSIALIDIGARSTTCSILKEAKLENSYSFEISGEELDEKIAEKFNISYMEAEKLKRKYGLLAEEAKAKEIREILIPLIDIVLIEIEKTFNNFYKKGGADIQKIILTGGGVLLPGLKEYFQTKLKREVVIFQPFSVFNYPPVLEKKLNEIGPSYAIAIGAALRGLE